MGERVSAMDDKETTGAASTKEAKARTAKNNFILLNLLFKIGSLIRTITDKVGNKKCETG